jgi:hypothetical protein
MQRSLLLLVSIVSVFIVLSFIRYIDKKIKLKKVRSHDIVLSAISIPFLFFSIVSIIFSSSPFKFTEQKFIIFLSFLIFTSTILLIISLSKIQKNNRILNPISFLLLSLIPPIINVSLIHIVIPMSLLVIIMTFLSFAEDHKNHITMLIVFSSISLVFYIVSFLSTRTMLLFTAISLSIFLLFITEFLKFLTTKKEIHLQINKKSDSKLIPFLKHLIFIIIITNFIFVGTVAIHELGHAVSAQFSDCEETKIVYELTGLPHTEVKCLDTSQSQNWTLLGIFLPMGIALLLMFGGGTSIKEISLEIIGFSLMISYLDFQTLGASILFSKIMMSVGVILSSVGLVLLVKSRADY